MESSNKMEQTNKRDKIMSSSFSHTIEPTGKMESKEEEYSYHIYNEEGHLMAYLMKPITDVMLNKIIKDLSDTV